MASTDFFCGALVLSDDVLAGGGDLSGVVGVGEAFLHRGEQFIGVLDLDGAVSGEEGIDGLLEVEGVGAEEGAFAQGGGLHHVGAAQGGEGPADEDDGCEGVEFSQVAHGVAEDDCGFAVSGAVFVFQGAVAHVIEAGFLNERGDFIEAFGFARDDRQAEGGETGVLFERAVGVEDDLFFVGAGAAGDPEGFGAEVQLGGEGVGAFDGVGDLCGVVLEGTGDDDLVVVAAQGLEAFGVFLSLGQRQGEAGEHWSDEAAEFEVAREAAVGDAAVYDDERDVSFGGDLREVGPDLQFHEQADGGVDVGDGFFHDGREVEGEKEDAHVVAVEGLGAGDAGVGGGADGDFVVGQSGLELGDEGPGGVDLADADGVNPDAWLVGAAAGDAAESLLPAGTVAILPQDAVGDLRAEGDEPQQIQ